MTTAGGVFSRLYSRGYLPHKDYPCIAQLITFRLDDSVPSRLLRAYSRVIDGGAPDDQSARWIRVSKHVERYLGKGKGSCRLRDPWAAKIVEDTLLFYEPDDYDLSAWVIMPNHVHVILRRTPSSSLASIVGRWKSWTARKINESCKTTGRFWQREWVDRWLRDEEALWSAIQYVELNPVVAGLCRTPLDWPFSSARRFPGRWPQKTRT